MYRYVGKCVCECVWRVCVCECGMGDCVSRLFGLYGKVPMLEPCLQSAGCSAVFITAVFITAVFITAVFITAVFITAVFLFPKLIIR